MHSWLGQSSLRSYKRKYLHTCEWYLYAPCSDNDGCGNEICGRAPGAN